MNNTTYIYALKDPRDGLIYYVGKSNNPTGRLKMHLFDKSTNRGKAEWISGLEADGLLPELEVLDEVPINEWGEIEKTWIAKGKKEGWPLLNIAPGGTGATFGGRYDKYDCVEFAKEYAGEAFATSLGKLPKDEQVAILRAMAISIFHVMDITKKSYAYFGIDMPIVARDPINLGWRIMNGDKDLLSKIDLFADDSGALIDGFGSYIYGWN